MVNVANTVIALKYKSGIMMITDTSCSYGSMKAHKEFQRLTTIGDHTLYACSGEMSDYQNLKKTLDEKYEEDVIENDGALFMGTKEYYNWVAAMQYQRRCRNNPQLITTVMAGFEGSQSFLGTVDSRGLKVEENFVATGFGNYFCQVLLTNHWRADMEEAEARALLQECLKVMFWRDKAGHDQFQVGTITPAGVKIGPVERLDTNKNFRFFHELTNDHFRPINIR